VVFPRVFVQVGELLLGVRYFMVVVPIFKPKNVRRFFWLPAGLAKIICVADS
jgi:hypothetical protein